MYMDRCSSCDSGGFVAKERPGLVCMVRMSISNTLLFVAAGTGRQTRAGAKWWRRRGRFQLQGDLKEAAG